MARCADVEWLRAESTPENPAARILGMSLTHHGQSSVSVMEVAQQSEKPGVYTPSRSKSTVIVDETGGIEIAGGGLVTGGALIVRAV